MSMQVARCDLQEKKFPIIIEALHPETKAVVWTETIEKPDGLAIVRIPPLRFILGHAVEIRCRFGDGEVQTTPAPRDN